MSIAENHLCQTYQQVHDKLAEVIHAHGSAEIKVQLLAVSKKQSAEKIKALFDCGQRAFGENYWQELQEKSHLLHELPIEWHFIGHVQSRKAREIARCCQWLHTVDRPELLPKLNEGAKLAGHNLQICIQVHLSHELTKHGVHPTQLQALAKAILDYPHLTLRGLMTIPAAVECDDSQKKFTEQQKPFAQLKQLLADLKTLPELKPYPLDTLSMGMSDDYPAAIAEKATIIRLGTLLFGKRA